jgi:hypothetical protein
VTVLDAKTGSPISGATVVIAGPAGSTDNTDATGTVLKKGIPVGAYTATAKNAGYTTENGQATVTAAATAKIEIKLTPITVTLALAQPVACPGHPLAITATGAPAGGTYAWTINSAISDLVDAGGAPVRAGAAVNLRGFFSDTATGNIPAQVAAITVTYTYTNGEKATANRDVTIHAITFTVTSTDIHDGVTQANETAASVNLSAAPGVATMKTDPQVKISLDASCPRKADCASNHQVGWLQKITSHTRNIRYRDSLGVWSMPIPIRDSYQAEPVFAYAMFVKKFTADGDTQTGHHEDSPGTSATRIDPRAAAPAPPPPVNRQLRQIIFQEGFSAWLVVQNIEWATHDIPGSMAYLKNLTWSLSLTVAVDTTKAVGSWCTPQSSVPTTPAMTNGKGGDNPVFGGNSANNSMTWTITAAAPPV